MSQGKWWLESDDAPVAAAVKEAIRPNLPDTVEDCHDLISLMAVQWIWVWAQYGSHSEIGTMQLGHAWMRAGEAAAETLERLGLGQDTGWSLQVRREVMPALFDESPEQIEQRFAEAERKEEEFKAQSAAGWQWVPVPSRRMEWRPPEDKV